MNLKEGDKIQFLEDIIIPASLSPTKKDYIVFHKDDYAYPKTVSEKGNDIIRLGFNIQPGDWDYYRNYNINQFKKIEI